ncbi:MAG: penicillin-binding protein 2 [Planctomycetota bacterium]|nr:penicillin-binding protein 2 [Planctomycetota bacterium]
MLTRPEHPADDSLPLFRGQPDRGQTPPGDSLSRRWRYDVVFILLMLGVGAMGVRLGIMARDRGEEASQMAQRQQRLTQALPARRGGIYLRAADMYVPAAVTRDEPLVYVDAAELEDNEIVPLCEDLARILGIKSEAICAKILDNRDSRYLVLQGELRGEEATAIRGLKHRALGIGFEPRRDYPNASLAAHVLGICRKDGNGGAGVEQTFQKILAAENGVQVMSSDSRRRATGLIAEDCRPPRDGSSVFLTIDERIQKTLETALAEAVETHKAMWATGVVVDPHNGDVLAMSSTPTFDPNTYQSAEIAHFANRAISMPFEPGSVAKGLFAALAVEAGVVNWDTKFVCEGTYSAPGGGRVGCHGHAHGTLTVAECVIYSCNVGMAKIGEKMGNRKLYDGAAAFGLGQRTGIPLPGESPGQMRPLKRWDGYSTRRIPFGQEISTTALQLVMAYSALANGGELLEPRLIDCVQDPAGQPDRRPRQTLPRRVISPKLSTQALKVLQQVVENEHSTGTACRLSKWTSWGKTGTAQVSATPPAKGYIEGAYTGSFLGGAPVENPRAICLISVYRPSKGHFGAEVAAPYVKKVLEEAMVRLRVPPDKVSTVAAGRP